MRAWRLISAKPTPWLLTSSSTSTWRITNKSSKPSARLRRTWQRYSVVRPQNRTQPIFYRLVYWDRSVSIPVCCVFATCSTPSRSWQWRTHLSVIRPTLFTPQWPHSNMPTPTATSPSTPFTKWCLNTTRSSTPASTSSNSCAGEVEKALPLKRTRATNRESVSDLS